MKHFIAKYMKIFSSTEEKTKSASPNREKRDIEALLERVDAQIGRAVTRLGER